MMRPPVVQRLAVERRGLGDAGIGDADRDRPARACGGGNAVADGGLVGDVHPQRVEARPRGSVPLQPGEVAPGDRDLRAAIRERLRDVEADARAAARHQRVPSRKLHPPPPRGAGVLRELRTGSVDGSGSLPAP
jgi:hypothetical protein